MVGDYTREELQPYLDEGVKIDDGYSVVVIEYVTGETTSLATVTIPYPRRPAGYAYPIVANAHGSVGLDDACALSGTVYGTAHAGLFGARGCIGIAPDGPGLGTPGLLPYLVSRSAGPAALDALRAATRLATALGLALSHRYAIVGSSEGGHTTLAAAAQHAAYAPELDIRAFAAAGPASVWGEQWQRAAAVDGPHIPYHAMLMYAWASYYDYAGPSIWAPQRIDQIDDIMRDSCSFDFDQTRSTYLDQLGDAASGVFEAEFLRAYRAGELAQDFPVFADAFAGNRIGPYRQTAPLAIWQGDSDTTILASDTQALVEALRAGGVETDYHLVPGGAHTTTAFGLLGQHQLATDESVGWVLRQLRR